MLLLIIFSLQVAYVSVSTDVPFLGSKYFNVQVFWNVDSEMESDLTPDHVLTARYQTNTESYFICDSIRYFIYYFILYFRWLQIMYLHLIKNIFCATDCFIEIWIRSTISISTQGSTDIILNWLEILNAFSKYFSSKPELK